jgi:hypothetical protein
MDQIALVGQPRRMETGRSSDTDLLDAWREASRAADLAARLALGAAEAAEQAQEDAEAADDIATMAEATAEAAERAALAARRAARRAALLAERLRTSRLGEAEELAQEARDRESDAGDRYHDSECSAHRGGNGSEAASQHRDEGG